MQVPGLCWTALLDGNESGKHGQEPSVRGAQGERERGDEVKEGASEESWRRR